MNYSSLLLLALLIQLSPASAQTIEPQNYKLTNDDEPPRNQIGFQLFAALVPKAGIQTTAGDYHIQPAFPKLFGAGVNYSVNLNGSFSMIYGLEIHMLSTNYFLHVPDADLNGFLSTGGAPQIQDKEVYFKLALPVMLAYRLGQKQQGSYSISAGLKLNYSGFSTDQSVSTDIADASLQRTTIFNGEFKSSNDKKPWVTFTASLSKNFIQSKRGDLSIALHLDISPTRFVEGSYTIAIPNKPVSTGTYAIRASYLGIGLQYNLRRVKNQ